jgi:predicted CoA-binding protein
MQKKTLVLGASPKAERYSYKAVKMLVHHQHPVVAVGARDASIDDVEIHRGQPDFQDIHTVTMYLGPANQKNIYDYIIKLQPKRIIFNPGTENQELMDLARQKKIEVEIACTLVLLSTNQY